MGLTAMYLKRNWIVLEHIRLLVLGRSGWPDGVAINSRTVVVSYVFVKPHKLLGFKFVIYRHNMPIIFCSSLLFPGVAWEGKECRYKQLYAFISKFYEILTAFDHSVLLWQAACKQVRISRCKHTIGRYSTYSTTPNNNDTCDSNGYISSCFKEQATEPFEKMNCYIMWLLLHQIVVTDCKVHQRVIQYGRCWK